MYVRLTCIIKITYLLTYLITVGYYTPTGCGCRILLRKPRLIVRSSIFCQTSGCAHSMVTNEQTVNEIVIDSS